MPICQSFFFFKIPIQETKLPFSNRNQSQETRNFETEFSHSFTHLEDSWKRLFYDHYTATKICYSETTLSHMENHTGRKRQFHKL